MPVLVSWFFICKENFPIGQQSPRQGSLTNRAVYNAPRFTVTPLAYPRKRPTSRLTRLVNSAWP